MCDRAKSVRVEDLLTGCQLDQIVTRCVDGRWQLIGCELRPAVDGLAGFAADHFRLKIQVQLDGQLHTLQLFMKTVPLHNGALLKFVEENDLFKREMTMFKLIEEMETVSGQEILAPKSLFCSESVIVMPDLVYEGYSVRNQLETFDLPHLLVALASVARFHAAFANHDTRKTLALQRPVLMEDHNQINIESIFKDTPWVRAGAKLTANIIQLSKYRNSIPDLEPKVLRQFLAGFEDLTESTDSLNVVLHKDLWVNNIMFKYEGDVPASAVLLDFQCARYGPPAFDVMMLMYLNTSCSFRQQHENSVLRHYFEIFTKSLDADTKFRLKGLGYDYEEFLRWVVVARRFGMVAGLMMFPSTLLDQASAGEWYRDPETADRLINEDRTAAVLAHARRCPAYGRRQLDLTEEFVEKYLLP